MRDRRRTNRRLFVLSFVRKRPFLMACCLLLACGCGGSKQTKTEPAASNRILEDGPARLRGPSLQGPYDIQVVDRRPANESKGERLSDRMQDCGFGIWRLDDADTAPDRMAHLRQQLSYVRVPDSAVEVTHFSLHANHQEFTRVTSGGRPAMRSNARIAIGTVVASNKESSANPECEGEPGQILPEEVAGNSLTRYMVAELEVGLRDVQKPIRARTVIPVTADWTDLAYDVQSVAAQAVEQAVASLVAEVSELDGGIYADPLRQLRTVADEGDADAQFSLGLSYAKGEGVPQDFAEAVRWTSMAAGQGHVAAQTNLGSAYYNGQGVARDLSNAAVWYRKAAEQGDARAQFSLGYMYAKGEGVPRDSAQAKDWYRRAADQKYAPAVAALGLTQNETSRDDHPSTSR